jgi:hypothetical protein
MKETIIPAAFAICALLLLACSITTYVQLYTSNYTYLQGMGTNWSAGPVMSINTKSLNCAADEDNLIDNNKWPGTREGCYCPNSWDLFEEDLREGRCKKSRDNRLWCSTIQAMTPIEYKSYKGRQMCAKRMPGSYLDLSIVANENSCPKDYRPCGIADTLNHVLCISRETDCPMNDVRIIGKNEPIPSDFEYTVLESNDAKILFTNKNTRGRVVNQFKIAEDQPCVLPFYEHTKGSLYLLDGLYETGTCKRGIGDTLYDQSFKKIDTYNMKSLFAENQISPVLNTLPKFNMEVYDKPVNLYTKNYIGVSPACLKEIKANKLGPSIIEDLLNMEAKMSKNLTMSLVIMILVIISSVFVAIYVFMYYSRPEDKASQCLFSCLPVTLSFVNVILCIILVTGISELVHHLGYLSSPECLDVVTYEAVSVFDGKISAASATNYIVLGCSFIMFGGPIAAYVVG